MGTEFRVDMLALATIAAAVFLWGLASARLERADVTGAIVFTLIGVLLVETGLVSGAVEPEAVRPLVETALVWVLFSDAARVSLRDLRADAGRCVRLLALGLPLSVLAGWRSRPGSSPGSAAGWPCWSARRWLPRTPRLAAIGTTMDAGTVLFVGWFGPRELASLVFALITMEELGAAADDAVAVITGTVLLSVVVHGISAAPLAARYGRSAATRERLVTPRG